VIQYSLICENRHAFDAWFKNAAAYDEQVVRGIVACPICSSQQVEKALMAPAVQRTGSEKIALSIGHPQQAQLRAAMKALKDKVTAEADYVGDRFASEARRMHDQEIEQRGIYGEATRDEVAGLVEDGVDFMPLPNLPEEHN